MGRVQPQVTDGNETLRFLILAAGKGERLRPLTDTIPKSLLHLNETGKTILDQQLQTFRKHAKPSDEIIVTVGYRSTQIIQHIERLRYENVKVCFNPLFANSNNLVSLWLTLRDIEDDVVIINGDNVVTQEGVDALLDFDSKDAIAITRKIEFNEDDMKALVEDNRLVDVGKKIPEYNAESVGFMKFSAATLKILKKTIDQSLQEPGGLDYFYLKAICDLARSERLEVVEISSSQWREVDFHPDRIEMSRWWSAKTQGLIGE